MASLINLYEGKPHINPLVARPHELMIRYTVNKTVVASNTSYTYKQNI